MVDPAPTSNVSSRHAEAELVIVTWEDTINIAAWQTPGDVAEWAGEGGWICQNIGWLIYQDDDCVVIAGRHCKGRTAPRRPGRTHPEEGDPGDEHHPRSGHETAPAEAGAVMQRRCGRHLSEAARVPGYLLRPRVPGRVRPFQRRDRSLPAETVERAGTCSEGGPMTSADFEDPRELARCIRSDCGRYRLNKDIPFCAFHLREQEVGSPGIVEPDLEAKVARIRSEDDDHPGQKKVWHDDGTAEWVDDEDWVAPPAVPVQADQYEHPFSTRPGPVQPAQGGCWVAYHSDWSGLALFSDELEALRHAVGNTMIVGWAIWGQELGGGRYPAAKQPAAVERAPEAASEWIAPLRGPS